MGVINHNAVIATTWSLEKADNLQEWIETLGDKRRLIIRAKETLVNGYHTFIVVPNGSKEGWEDSDNGDRLRERVIIRLSKDNYEDNSSPWNWVEVGFGEFGQKVLRGNCKNCYSDSEYYNE